MEIGVPELLVILVVVLLVFGVGRIARLGGELGQGIREFRRGLQGGEEHPPLAEQPPQQEPRPSAVDEAP